MRTEFWLISIILFVKINGKRKVILKTLFFFHFKSIFSQLTFLSYPLSSHTSLSVIFPWNFFPLSDNLLTWSSQLDLGFPLYIFLGSLSKLSLCSFLKRVHMFDYAICSFVFKIVYILSNCNVFILSPLVFPCAHLKNSISIPLSMLISAFVHAQVSTFRNLKIRLKWLMV